MKPKPHHAYLCSKILQPSAIIKGVTTSAIVKGVKKELINTFSRGTSDHNRYYNRKKEEIEIHTV
ncbi:MAG: hypothetical protein ACI90V_003891 [Bacillariaceae sp.]|jgi:hypothetical protein